MSNFKSCVELPMVQAGGPVKNTGANDIAGLYNSELKLLDTAGK